MRTSSKISPDKERQYMILKKRRKIVKNKKQGLKNVMRIDR